MTALADARTNPKQMIGNTHYAPVAADAVIYQGAMVALNAGYLVPASTALGLVVIGVAHEAVDNTGGANGDKLCRITRGNWLMKNSAAADEITVAEIGTVVYAVDDQTVAKTDGGGTRSEAGVLHWFDDSGPWVALGI